MLTHVYYISQYNCFDLLWDLQFCGLTCRRCTRGRLTRTLPTSSSTNSREWTTHSSCQRRTAKRWPTQQAWTRTLSRTTRSTASFSDVVFFHRSTLRVRSAHSQDAWLTRREVTRSPGVASTKGLLSFRNHKLTFLHCWPLCWIRGTLQLI